MTARLKGKRKSTLNLAIASAIAFSCSSLVVSASIDNWDASEENAEKAFIAGNYDDADRLWKLALVEAEKNGQDDLKVASTLNQMTHLFIKQKRYNEAYTSLKRALAIRTKVLGQNNILTAETMGNLALVDQKLGADFESEKLYQSVLEIKEKKLGDTSPSVATTKTNLANLYAEMSRCSEAKSLYLEALAIDEKAFGASHEEVAADLLNVGALLYHCDHPQEALTYLQRSAKINDANDAAKISALHYIGLCQAKLKDPAAAEAAYRQALTAQIKTKGAGHPDTIVHILNIARAADDQGRTDEAEKMYKEAIDTLKHASSPDTFKITECEIELAHFYHRHNKNEDAETSYKTALQTYDTLSRVEQRKLYELPRAYADLLKELKRDKDGDAMAQKYLNLYEPKVGDQIK